MLFYIQQRIWKKIKAIFKFNQALPPDGYSLDTLAIFEFRGHVEWNQNQHGRQILAYTLLYLHSRSRTRCFFPSRE